MKKNLILALFLSVAYLGRAQQPTTRPADGRVNFLTSSDRFQYINPFDDRLINMRGTRFFFDSIYHPGELQTAKTLYTTELQYRFDQIERMVQVKLESGKELWLNEKDVVYFKMFLGDKEVLFIPAAVPNGRKLTLLQVIYKSPTMQLLRDSRKYIFRVKSDNIDGYSSENVYDDVRKDYRYFFNKGESLAFSEVKKIDAKSFAKVMPDKKIQIAKLFKAGQAKEGLSITKLAAILKELDVKEETTQ